MRATARFLERQRGKIAEHRKDIRLLPKTQLVSEYRAAVTAERRLAAALELLRNNQFGELNPEEHKAVLELALRYGLEKEILEANPYLITDNNATRLVTGAQNRIQALTEVVKGVEDKSAIGPNPNTKEYDDTQVISAIVYNVKGTGDVANLYRKNRRLYTKTLEHLRANETQLRTEFTLSKQNGGIGKTIEDFEAIRGAFEDYEAGRLKKGPGQRQRRQPSPGGGQPSPGGGQPANSRRRNRHALVT